MSMLAFEIEHLLATLGATDARGDALLHILAESLATLCARPTDFGASGAELCVHIECSEHRIRSSAAYFCAAQHQAKVSGLDMSTPLLEAVSHRHV
jgi:hypothetical protein